MKTVAFYTLGCRVNQYETTALAELFIKNGYIVVDFSDKSDLYIINTCAVTQESERKSSQMIRRALKKGGKVAVIGCYSQLHPDLDIEGVSFIGGSKEKQAVFYQADKILSDDKQVFADTDLVGYGYEEICIGEKNPIFSTCRAYVKIQDGCNGRCSYCIIPKTRGRERSRPLVDIMSEIHRLTSSGYKEIVLTGIEVAAYDYAPLSELIRMIDRVEGVERLRFGSLSPNSINDDFLEAAKSAACFMPHIHLSLQSGSERILNLMRRPYKKQRMCDSIEAIYKKMPNTLISADIIVGFPTETDEDFEQTLQLVSKYKLSHVHAFPFSPRPGTDAAKMTGRLQKQIVKKRNETLILRSNENKRGIFERKIGYYVNLLVEKTDGMYCFGHTEDFLEAKVLASEKKQVGDIVKAKIISYEGMVLSGKEA